jgi:septal ring factor EnvC (AmiA/AmiB activator)
MLRLKEEQSAQAVALERVIKERDALKAKIETERSVLQERVQQKEMLVSRVAQEKQNLEVLLSELKAESLRLEVVVSSLTSDDPKGGPSERASVRLPPALPPAREKEEDPARIRSPAREVGADTTSMGGAQQGAELPFEGPGLRALRKSLAPPARGVVVRRFGKQRHGEFSDFVFQRGVELSVPPEKPIKAVAPGKVVFAGELPGFGKVVILDHGKRSYSLYGRLKEQLAQHGSALEKGAPVGLVGVADRRGSNFYFEVRENGAPVNPASLFSNL